MTKKKKTLVQTGKIGERILQMRGEKVIIDADLAKFYGVTTKRLNEQVKRNRDRFPEDFMFQLKKEEADTLRPQIATSKTGRGGRRYLPYAFTEHGALMAATVLNTKLAVEMSVFIVRAFVKLRQTVADHKELSQKLSQIEARLADHDEEILSLIEAMRELLSPASVPPKKRIGFYKDEG
jgi:hypothetical protein